MAPVSRTAEERFWDMVQKDDYCWQWTGARNKVGGYGQFWSADQKKLMAHRYSWMLFNGPISSQLCVCHTCDNPVCVNPAHLWLGTHQDNMRDREKKGRYRNSNSLKTHCKRGHEFTPENTKRTGHIRQCRTCIRFLEKLKRPRHRTYKPKIRVGE